MNGLYTGPKLGKRHPECELSPGSDCEVLSFRMSFHGNRVRAGMQQHSPREPVLKGKRNGGSARVAHSCFGFPFSGAPALYILEGDYEYK